MTKTKIVTSPYHPRKGQLELHRNLKRFTTVVAHRRWGKSIFCINHLIQMGLKCQLRNPRYCYISPEKAQCVKNVWDEFMYYGSFIPSWQEHTKNSYFSFTNPNGQLVKIYIEGADDPSRFRGQYYDGIVLDEVGYMADDIFYGVLFPALSDRKGSVIFIGTPQGKNAFYDYYMKGKEGKEGWATFEFSVYNSGIYAEEEIQDFKNNMPTELFEQEYNNSFTAAIQGTFYGRYLNDLRNSGFVGSYPYNDKYPVITGWDLGLNDATCIWFAQVIQGYVYIIDFITGKNMDAADYGRMLLDKPYTYSYHILPHDAAARIDSKRTHLGELKALGLKCRVLKKSQVMSGITTVRILLPKCRFNATACSEGLDNLFHYRSVPNSKTGYMDTEPLHDKHSHAADAFRYLAIGIAESSMTTEEMKTVSEKHTHYSDYDAITGKAETSADPIALFQTPGIYTVKKVDDLWT